MELAPVLPDGVWGAKIAAVRLVAVDVVRLPFPVSPFNSVFEARETRLVIFKAFHVFAHVRLFVKRLLEHL